MNAFTAMPWKRQIALAMLLLSVGQLVSVLGMTWSKIPALLAMNLHVHSVELTNDFVHGFLIGVGIAINILAVALLLIVARSRTGDLPGEGLGLM